MMIHTSDGSFQHDVLQQSGKPVLVDFYADWCGPCRMIAPILEDLSRELGEQAVIAKVNVDNNPAIATRYGIMSIPTLKLFKDGREVKTVVGLQGKQQLLGLLRSAM